MISVIRQRVLRTDLGYRAYMSWRWGAGPRSVPSFQPRNETLKNARQVRRAVEEAHQLKLPPCADGPKTWDTLGALTEILSQFPPSAVVLDAGAERYSRLLPWLYLYGFRNLIGNNLVFDKPVRYGPILYERGDITRTRFPDGHFDAITCLSVIEHGVDLQSYFREMARILKVGGLLITSTDYFEHPIDTQGKCAYGGPVRVFARQDIEGAFQVAAHEGLRLTGDVDLDSEEKVVHWEQLDLRYSFLLFSMTRTGPGATRTGL